MEEAEFMTKYTENSEGSAYTSFTTMEPGANREGWWDADDVYEQTIQVLRIFEWLHPKAIGLFIFDNSKHLAHKHQQSLSHHRQGQQWLQEQQDSEKIPD